MFTCCGLRCLYFKNAGYNKHKLSQGPLYWNCKLCSIRAYRCSRISEAGITSVATVLLVPWDDSLVHARQVRRRESGPEENRTVGNGNRLLRVLRFGVVFRYVSCYLNDLPEENRDTFGSVHKNVVCIYSTTLTGERLGRCFVGLYWSAHAALSS